MSKRVVKKDGLTDLEIIVLEAARKTDYGDCLIDPEWSFAVCDKSGLPEKVYRGVVSSLIKKGLITIWDNEGKGQYRDMVFEFTDKGKVIFVSDRDLDKKEAERAVETLKTIGINSDIKFSGGRWVVIGTLDDATDYCIATRKEYDILMFALNDAGLKAIGIITDKDYSHAYAQV